MASVLRVEDVRALLAKACEVAGGQHLFARAHGLSPQYVNDVLGGKHPGASILAALRLERVELFRRLPPRN